MTVSKKGKRKIVVEGRTYYWYVKEGEEWTDLELTVILEERLFLHRSFGYAMQMRLPKPITPEKVRQEILKELEYNRQRKILSALPDAEAPDGWQRIADLPEPCPYGIGLDDREDMLLAVYYPQKGELPFGSAWVRLYSLEDCREIASEVVSIRSFSNRDTSCLGIGPLAGKRIPFAGWSQSGLLIRNPDGDLLYQPPFSPKDIYFQPSGQNCLDPAPYDGCYRLWHGTYPHQRFGFAASGRRFVLVRDQVITVWGKLI